MLAQCLCNVQEGHACPLRQAPRGAFSVEGRDFEHYWPRHSTEAVCDAHSQRPRLECCKPSAQRGQLETTSSFHQPHSSRPTDGDQVGAPPAPVARTAGYTEHTQAHAWAPTVTCTHLHTYTHFTAYNKS